MFLYGLGSMLWCTMRFPHNYNVGGLMSYLRYLCLLAHRVVEQIYCCVFLRIVYSMLPVSLYCSFFIAPSVFSTVYILLVLLVTNLSVFKLFYLYCFVLEHVNCTISVKSVTYLVDTCMTMWFRIDSISTSSTFWKQKRNHNNQRKNKKKNNKTK